jgi:TonB-linked SusC/RagA family outer membrane protein
MKNLPLASLLALCFLSFAAGSAMAQTGTIKGKITDKQTGETLPGATIVVEGTAHGAAADVNGNYTIENVPTGRYQLVARYIGYQAETVIVDVKDGETTTQDFELAPSGYTTNPVVVTAIGTQESRAHVGTAVSSVAGQSLVLSGSNNVITDLAAKAPGVYTTETSGDPGAATRIVLRGIRSLQGDNQPLVVVDGEPVFSGTVGGLNMNNSSGSAIGGNDVGGVTAMSILNSLNPQDIASVEIYKGPSAAAIWGSQGANGVIVITTKSGTFTPGKKVNISLRSNTQVDNLLREFPLQTQFGQGANGAYMWNSPFSWGDQISARSGAADVRSYSYAYAPITAKNSKTVYDHAGELFSPAVSEDYGATITGGDQSGNFYLDLDRLGQNGIVKANSSYNQTSIRTSVTRTFAQGLTIDLNAAYVNSSSDRIQQGSNISGLLLGAYRTAPDFNNLPYLVNYVSPTGAVTPAVQRTYRNGSGNPASGMGYDNPFFTVYMNPTTIALDHLTGSSSISYDAADWLNFTYRAGVDYLTDRDNTELAPYDASQKLGQLIRNVNTAYMVNSDLMGRANHSFSDDFTSTLLVGFHLDNTQYDNTGIVGTDFIIPTAPPTLGNAASYAPGESKIITRNAALYGQLNLNFYKQLFFTLAGRDESSSTYGPDVPSLFFYPSASVAWEFTQLPMFKDNSILTYGKLRAAYGEAAVQPPAYSTNTYVVANPVIGNGFGPGIGLQYYGGGVVSSTTLGNSALGPEKTTESEFGLDLRLLDDRVAMSLTAYHDITTDAILGLNVAPSSGFSAINSNAAKLSNVGYEAQMTVDWLRFGNFSWQTVGNWSTNHNIVYDLSGVTNVFLSGFTDPASEAVLGQQVGVLYGTRWERNANGSITLGGGSNGLFPVGDAATPGVIGDPNPKYVASVSNTFRLQRFTFSFTFDWKVGGQVWNGTKGALSYFGKAGDQNWWTTISATQATTLLNYDGYTVAQMANGEDWGLSSMPASAAFRKNSDGTYSFRGYVHNFGGGNVIVDESYFYDGPGSGFTGPAEQFIEDGSYVRLQQVSLSYSIPLKTIGLESLQLSVIGRNLALWTKYTGVDPQANLTGPTNGQGLDYFNNPSVKTWIFSIAVNY